MRGKLTRVISGLLVVVLLVLSVAFLFQLVNLMPVSKYAFEKFVREPLLRTKYTQDKKDIDMKNSCDYQVSGGQGLVPKRIIIDSIALDLPIKTQQLINGTWKVEDYVANYAQGTSLISPIGGNVGLYGHDRKSAITDIKKVTIGETIEIISDEYLALYQVTQSQVVEPSAVDVFYPTQHPTLTLVTCDGTLSSQRYVLQAALQSIKKINCDENI